MLCVVVPTQMLMNVLLVLMTVSRCAPTTMVATHVAVVLGTTSLKT